MGFNFFLKGCIIGFSIAAPVGPIGVLCIKRSLTQGRASGFVSGLGAATADMIYGIIAGLGLTVISTFLISQQLWLRFIGGLFLCYLGIKTFTSKPSEHAAKAEGTGLLSSYMSTFFLTVTNPMTIISFMAVFAGLGGGAAGKDYFSVASIVTGVFTGSALWWFTLSTVAGMFRAGCNSCRLRWINRISGIVITIFGIIILSGNICNASEKGEKTHMIEKGVYIAPVIISKSLESRREEFEETLIASQIRIREFAKTYGWENLTEESFFDRVEIYDSKEVFDRRVKEITETDPSVQLPRTYSAVLEKRILVAVSPEIFRENYPQGIEDKFYEKIMAHEIAHRLHIRILNGNEEAMGPVWFFEGFAIYAANQFEHSSLVLSDEEIGEIIRSEERGSYEKYAFVFRYFVKKRPVKEMVEEAGKKDFIQFLYKL